MPSDKPKRLRKPKNPTTIPPDPIKGGTIREDGFVFKQYSKHKCANGETTYREEWLSPQAYKRSRITNIIYQARKRAKASGVPFNITTEHLISIFPEDSLCPVLGIPMKFGDDNDGRDNSPSVDRIIPTEGYVEGNVVWVSYRANRIKNDASLEELKKLVHFYERYQEAI
jgi:hypothetical protein